VMAADTWWHIAAVSGDKSSQIKLPEIDVGGIPLQYQKCWRRTGRTQQARNAKIGQ